jgi:hypothetical protein
MNEPVANNIVAKEKCSGLVRACNLNALVASDLMLSRNPPMSDTGGFNNDDAELCFNDVNDSTDDRDNNCSLKRTVCEMRGPAHRRRRLSLNALLSRTRELSLYSSSDGAIGQSTDPMIDSCLSETSSRRRRNKPSESSPTKESVRFADHTIGIEGDGCKRPANDESDDRCYEYEALPLNEENELIGYRRKRRRFERRNSKTPAMLMSIISPMIFELRQESFIDYESSERRTMSAVRTTLISEGNPLPQDSNLTSGRTRGEDVGLMDEEPQYSVAVAENLESSTSLSELRNNDDI